MQTNNPYQLDNNLQVLVEMFWMLGSTSFVDHTDL